jgi:hypothetical protein
MWCNVAAVSSPVASGSGLRLLPPPPDGSGSRGFVVPAVVHPDGGGQEGACEADERAAAASVVAERLFFDTRFEARGTFRGASILVTDEVVTDEVVTDETAVSGGGGGGGGIHWLIPVAEDKDERRQNKD